MARNNGSNSRQKTEETPIPAPAQTQPVEQAQTDEISADEPDYSDPNVVVRALFGPLRDYVVALGSPFKTTIYTDSGAVEMTGVRIARAEFDLLLPDGSPSGLSQPVSISKLTTPEGKNWALTTGYAMFGGAAGKGGKSVLQGDGRVVRALREKQVAEATEWYLRTRPDLSGGSQERPERFSARPRVVMHSA